MENTSASTFRIRPIEAEDCAAMKTLIIEVLKEHGCVGPGYACNDPELDDLFTYYQNNHGRYWVAEDSAGNIIGGGGYARLKGTTPEDKICELQKLYIYAQGRGAGLGRKLLLKALEEAARDGYLTMYLETIHAMKPAIHLYEKLGFTFLDGPMGATGHTSCPVHMSRSLADVLVSV